MHATLLLLAAVAQLCPSALAARTLEAKGPTRAPVLDGKVVADPAWKDAPVATDFRLLGRPDQAATQTTTARVLYDHQHLYVGFVCAEDRMDKLVTAVKVFDGPTYQDDCVELFVAPGADRTRYYHFVVNAAGVVRDEMGQDARWNSRARVAARREQASWSVEVAIPLTSLQLDHTVSSTWGVNFCREEQPHGELSSWAPCKSGFHEPESFGELTGLELNFAPLVAVSLRARAQAAARALEAVEASVADYMEEQLGRVIRGACQRQLDQLEAVRIALDRKPDLLRLRDLTQKVMAAEQETEELRARAARLPLLQAAGRAGYVVCAESPLTKIPPDKPYTGRPARKLEVTLARNEYEPAQIVVVPLKETLHKVVVSVTDLKGPGQAVLPASSVKVNVVGYVEVKQSSGGAPLPPGLLPDPLLENRPTEVDKARVQSWWLTVYAPAGQKAGVYRGEVRVRPHNAPETRIPLQVRVWDFALPTTSRLRTSYGLNMSHVLSKYDAATGPGRPPGWYAAAWTGADVSGTPNYFGSMKYRLAFDYEIRHSGKRSCRVEVTEVVPGAVETPRFCYYTEELKLEPNTDYELSVWYRTAPGDRHGPSGYFGAAGATYWPPTDGQWKQGRYAFNSGNGTGIRVYLKVDQVGTVWFDDVRLAPRGAGRDANVLPNPDFERGEEGMQERIRDAYVLNMLRHRASPTNIIAPAIETAPDGTLSVDWTEFDRVMEPYVNAGLSAFNVFWCQLPAGWGTVESVEDQQRLNQARELLRQTQEHLQQRGWLGLAYIYTIDEPGADFFPQVRRAFALAHEAAPKLKTLLTYGYGASKPIEPGAPRYADLAGYVDIHVPHTDCFEPIYLRQRQEMGDEVWAYVCISAMRPYLNVWGIDYPGLDHRLLFWQLFQHRITGFLYWEVAYWVKDPWQDTMTYPGGNADGSLIYPGEDGPVDSIRWELCRDGTEDYDMLTLLRETSATLQARRKAPPTDDPLLHFPQITRSWTEYCQAPEVLEAHRERVGNRLEQLSRMLARQRP